MSNYEFWDELGKIFNAVVAYQEKSIEFNKRFINPWIRLGNVFDKQDRNTEAINAYKKAIELDPANPQNWYELGNIYFQMGSYEEAADAYNKVIELQPDSGWACSNLAFTLAKQGKCDKAIPLYQKSIDLLNDDKDKAIAWNRLGNVYRKQNEYELALDAFQKADELDQENAGFRDELDDVTDGPTLVEGNDSVTSDAESAATADIVEVSAADVSSEDAIQAEDTQEMIPSVSEPTSEAVPDEALSLPSAPESSDDTQSDVAASATDDLQDDVQVPADAATSEVLLTVNVVEGIPADLSQETEASTADVIAISNVIKVEDAVSEADQAENDDAELATDTTAESSDETKAPEADNERTITIIVQNIVETYTDSQIGTETVTQTSDADIAVAATDGEQADTKIEEPAVAATEQTPLDVEAEPVVAISEVEVEAETVIEEDTETLVTDVDASETIEQIDETEVQIVDEPIEISDPTSDDSATSVHAAYDEFLSDNSEELAIQDSEPESTESDDQDSIAMQDPVAKIDASGEVQIEVDTKNAHVWNELGNVYFNTAAYDDAVAAYSKAIELDRQFAWPYSNLALTYVQKGRFVEAILLYQRSIELFSGEKDKAISWNRLGNVYRRLNDYDNAISAYQRADELDPDNTTLSMQSRFSLLGNYLTESKPSYAS